MRFTVSAAALAAALVLLPAVTIAPADARPGGCIKYGAAGAAAGYAAGHTWKGALAGCALGWYERRRYKRSLREGNRPPASM